VAATRGSMISFSLAPGTVSRAVAHKTVEEIWYVVAGCGGHGITYAAVAELTTQNGLPETEGSITVKINKRGFPTWFFR
jgi:hypothetical protein